MSHSREKLNSELSYTPGKQISQGNFSRVFTGIAHDSLRTSIVIKVAKTSYNTELSQAILENFQREAEVFKRIEANRNQQNGSRYIISCYFIKPATFSPIIVSFANNKSLSNWIYLEQNKDDFPWSSLACRLALQLAQGIEFLNAAPINIIHFDIKPDNLLVHCENEENQLKIIDFGLSQDNVIGKELKMQGTPFYLPLEILLYTHKTIDQFTQSVDVYAFACVIFEMLTRTCIHDKNLYHEQLIETLRSNYQNLNTAKALPKQCTPRISNLLFSCWNQNRIKRPKIAECVKILAEEYQEQQTIVPKFGMS